MAHFCAEKWRPVGGFARYIFKNRRRFTAQNVAVFRVAAATKQRPTHTRLPKPPAPSHDSPLPVFGANTRHDLAWPGLAWSGVRWPGLAWPGLCLPGVPCLAVPCIALLWKWRTLAFIRQPPCAAIVIVFSFPRLGLGSCVLCTVSFALCLVGVCFLLFFYRVLDDA